MKLPLSKIREICRSLIKPKPVAFPVKKVNIGFEILPRVIGDVVRHPEVNISAPACAVYDANGFESINDAIIATEATCSRVLRYVEPKNLLFIFSESSKPLLHAFVFLKGQIAEIERYWDDCKKHTDTREEYETDNRFVVFCLLKDIEPLKKAIGGKQENPAKDERCHQITWGEFQELKKRLGYIAHISL